MSINHFLDEAALYTQTVSRVLMQRGLLPEFEEIVLTERNGLVWLILILAVERLNGLLERYISRDTLHQISTALGGRWVFPSNSSGLRYLVLVSTPPQLPEQAPYPEAALDNGVFPLGVGLGGPIHLRLQRNLLVAGEPGSGKSNFELLLVLTALRHGQQVYLADPDVYTFNSDLFDPLAAQPVAQSHQELRGLIEHLEAELARRIALFQVLAQRGQPPADVEDYNRLADQPLQRVLFVVDEANSYFDHRDIQERLQDLARRGRKWGLVIVLAAHNWRAKDVSRSLSASFPNRVCFRVSDDTSGMVVLQSRISGKRAMGLRQPGRGILLLDGRTQVFQAYRAPEDHLLRLSAGQVPAPLDNLECALVQYALEHLDGRFIVNQLAQVFAGQGMTSHQVKILAQTWERRGWLTSPAHATDARRLTPELCRLAGQERTGAQAAQERTGIAQVAQEKWQCA